MGFAYLEINVVYTAPGMKPDWDAMRAAAKALPDAICDVPSLMWAVEDLGYDEDDPLKAILDDIEALQGIWEGTIDETNANLYVINDTTMLIAGGTGFSSCSDRDDTQTVMVHLDELGLLEAGNLFLK